MGNRANFVIVQDSDWQLYYSHWAGCRILDSLIGGPGLALRYAASLRPCAKNQWTDAVWADGGAVVDLDRGRLLFFGDELMVDMNERRAVMSVLGSVWPGYSIGWAYDGTAELAAYVGAALRPAGWDRHPAAWLADDRNSMCHLVTVVDYTGRLRMWPLWWGHSSQAWHGPDLLNRLPGRGVARLELGEIPEGGTHVDVSKKMVGAWQTADTLGVFHALPELWDGWDTEIWDDRFEAHVERCRGVLRVPELDASVGIDNAQNWLRKRVFQDFAESPAGRIAELATLLGSESPGLSVGADAVGDCGVRPTDAEWGRFVDACDGLRTRRAESA